MGQKRECEGPQMAYSYKCSEGQGKIVPTRATGVKDGKSPVT